MTHTPNTHTQTPPNISVHQDRQRTEDTHTERDIFRGFSNFLLSQCQSLLYVTDSQIKTASFVSDLQRLLLSLLVEQWDQLHIGLCDLLSFGLHVTKTGCGHCYSCWIRWGCTPAWLDFRLACVFFSLKLRIVNWKIIFFLMTIIKPGTF